MNKNTLTVARMSAVVLAAGLTGSLVGCANTAPPSDVLPPATSPADSQNGSGSPQDGISLEQAGKVATDKYGGTILSIEDDSFNGEPAWEVEISDSSEGRIEVKVSKATGAIINVDHD